MNEKLMRIIKAWGFDESAVIVDEHITYETDRQPHVWTICENYILKMTTNKHEMMNHIHLINLLRTASIPSQNMVSTMSGESFVVEGNQCYGLFTKIKGEVLKDYFDEDYVKRGLYLGQCVANLHTGLKLITPQLLETYHLYHNDMKEELSGWVDEAIKIYLQTNELSEKELNLFHQITADFNQNFKDLYDSLPRQVIHRDVHGENMIFNDEVLVGYIDFDLSQMNARLFDVCYLCTGALAQSFNDEDKKAKWLPFARAVVTGYDEINPLTIAEKQSIKYMMIAIELIMIAYFAREGYEELAHTNLKMLGYIVEQWDAL